MPTDQDHGAPTTPSLPDLCRRAILLLDRYSAARETALQLATMGSGVDAALGDLDHLHREIARGLDAVDDEAPQSSPGPWWRRSHLAASGVIDAEGWPVELAALAAASEARAEPGARGCCGEAETGSGEHGDEREPRAAEPGAA